MRIMWFLRFHFGVVLGSLLLTSTLATASETGLSYEHFVLPNGLTVLVHEDHKAPIVAVDVWYHVGSANELPGKTGFAHLFEHLMFGGSEHVKGSYLVAMQKAGAAQMNGTTNKDRTNFYEVVPVASLDYALFLESDRMGHFVLDQNTLDLQRGVVQNEKRQHENSPYAVTEELKTKSTYPALHPYAHTVIGSMDDLNAASLADVKTWFATYYGPSNATLVLAGDITAAKAHELVEKYFAAIPPGPPVAHQQEWVAKRTGLQLESVQDRVPEPMILQVWNLPPLGDPDDDYLQLACNILASGTNSRLYKKLVYEMKVATSVQAIPDLNAIGGQLNIRVRVKPSAHLPDVEAAIQAVLKQLITEGPTEEELKNAKVKAQTQDVFSLDSVLDQAETLAWGQVFLGDPDANSKSMERTGNATALDVKSALNRWLSDGEYRLEVVPFPKLAAAMHDVDRSVLPVVGKAEALRMPRFEHMTLKNGLQVVLAERRELPAFDMTLIVRAGYAADHGGLPGTASMTAALLLSGTNKDNALQLGDKIDRLGLQVSSRAAVDTTNISISGLSSNLNPALGLLSEIVEHPAFAGDEFDRRKKLQLATIEQEKSQAMTMATRVLPPLLFGDEHPYGTPLTGSGTADSVAKMDRADLVRFHDLWFHPNNATLVVVGDTTLEQIKPLLEETFSSWKPEPLPKLSIPEVASPVGHGIYLIDRQGASQSNIIVGTIAPPQNGADEVGMEMWNDVLSGSFTSRLNLNLRENKHWSYGTHSLFIPTGGQRPYLVTAAVQTDKTKESIVEIEKEIRAIVGDRPLTEQELEGVVDNLTKSLPGSRETLDSVDAAIRSMVAYHLPEDYFTTLATRAEALQPATAEAAAKTFFHPDQLVWVVVGDRAKIEDGLKQLDLGPVHVIDQSGSN
jgi:zinc protease